MSDLTIGFLRCDVPNKNGIVFPEHVMEDAITKLNNRGDVVYGTIGQPEYGPTIPGLLIEDISHRCENFKIIDGVVTADMSVLETPKGEALKFILENDPSNFRFSCGGIGKMDMVDDVMTVTEFEITRISCMSLANVNWE
jgi:hypothetical protein